MRNPLDILRACSKLKDLFNGSIIHCELIKLGNLDKDIYVGSSLICMYAKCGALIEAQKVFDQLSVQNVVIWTALIAGYAEHGHGEEALICFERMQNDGISPDASAFICILKACGNMKAVEKGHEIHSDILRAGFLQENALIGTALVDMYVKCGLLVTAQAVFDELQVRDVVSWSVLISGYAECGPSEKTLEYFEQMLQEGVSPDAVTFLSVLKACGSIGEFVKGQRIHHEIIRMGLHKHLLIGTALVDMYAKCGMITKSEEIFDKLQTRDRISWNVLIAGYTEHGHIEEAMKGYECMHCEGLLADSSTFLYILNACGSIGSISKGKEIHTQILSWKSFAKDVLVGNALVDMYAKCGALVQAEELFLDLLARDVTSWNAIITGYIQNGHDEEALNHYTLLQRESILPNLVTYISILKTCGNLKVPEKGKIVHAQILEDKLADDEILVQNELINMYARSGAIRKARQVFEAVEKIRDAVSWTALISGYSQQKHVEEAVHCFHQMQHESQYPNDVTIICILKACASIGAADKGVEIHDYIVRVMLLKENIQVANALLDMYAKCNMLMKAQAVLDELHLRDVVSWTTVISGYAQNGHGEEAQKCFERMQCEAVVPNVVTFVCMLKGSGSIGAIKTGREIHSRILNEQMQDILVGNALVDLYAKCGLLEELQAIFDELPFQNVISWTALIAGYGQQGFDDVVIELFNQMIAAGVEPNSITFSVVLSACSHAGLLDTGLFYFISMSTCYGIMPTLEHYTCLVDLFGRLGSFENAVALVKKMPAVDYLPLWAALLGACQKWGNLKLGRCAFDHAIQLDESDIVSYVCMRNIYASVKEDTRMIEFMAMQNLVDLNKEL